jgi:hypothetical protein
MIELMSFKKNIFDGGVSDQAAIPNVLRAAPTLDVDDLNNNKRFSSVIMSFTKSEIFCK